MTWLHNSGGGPRPTIIQIARPALATTTGILLQLPRDLADTSVNAILAQLGVAGRMVPKAARALLSELLNQRALTLPFPPAALVSDRVNGSEQTETDLLTVCAVLSKSSNRLYLRDKEPNLNGILKARRAILQIPKNWRRYE